MEGGLARPAVPRPLFTGTASLYKHRAALSAPQQSSGAFATGKGPMQ